MWPSINRIDLRNLTRWVGHRSVVIFYFFYLIHARDTILRVLGRSNMVRWIRHRNLLLLFHHGLWVVGLETIELLGVVALMMVCVCLIGRCVRWAHFSLWVDLMASSGSSFTLLTFYIAIFDSTLVIFLTIRPRTTIIIFLSIAIIGTDHHLLLSIALLPRNRHLYLLRINNLCFSSLTCWWIWLSRHITLYYQTCERLWALLREEAYVALIGGYLFII